MSGHEARLDRRRHAEEILRAAIAAADPAPLVERALHGAIELAGTEPVHVIAVGKAAPAMVEPVLAQLGDRVASTLIVAPHGTHSARPTLFAAHPAPDEGSLAAGRAVVDVLDGAGAGDIVLVLLSGGASSTIAVPLDGISTADYADCVTRLMRAGADIRELNIVRKHIDAIKGGRMTLRAAPATVLGLVLSDVVGDPLDVIASGPLSPDATSCDDALHVLRRHGLLDDCAASIRRVLESCAADGVGETPDGDAVVLDSARVRVIGGNDVAVNGAADCAAALGYRVVRAPDPVTGTAREAGYTLAREARLLQRTEQLPVCIVAGGETTVAVQGRGRGGRNQELVLAACIALDGAAGITVGSVGTDGVDGTTDAAGAIADEATLELAAARGAAAAALLEDNDSHAFFTAADGLVVTGPTGTNVNDVQIALIGVPLG
jgi:glycerate 2-kinase